MDGLGQRRCRACGGVECVVGRIRTERASATVISAILSVGAKISAKVDAKTSVGTSTEEDLQNPEKAEAGALMDDSGNRRADSAPR